MRWFFYDIIFVLIYLLLLPRFALRMLQRGGYKARFADRFGLLPAEITAKLRKSRKRVWIHAVSVGEVFVAGQVIREMRSQNNSLEFLLSTTSSTGWTQAQKLLTDDDILIYCPLDISCCVKRVVAMVAPSALILTESEIWPNLIRVCSQNDVPVFLINARISDRSAPRYTRMRWWFEPVFNMFTKIMAQSEIDYDRLVAAGAPPDRIAVRGSFKFDVAQRNYEKEKELHNWMASHDVNENNIVLLGGSTWPGEDFIMVNTYRELARQHPELRLVIVPRHFEKADEVERTIVRNGLICVRKSRGDSSPESNYNSFAPVLLADTTGELMGFYALAQIVFVGKSLYEHGGQNMIEPCLCGAAVVVGPHTENFRPVMFDLLKADAVVQVMADDMVMDEVEHLLEDAARRQELGDRAIQVVEKRRGVVARCVKDIIAVMSEHSEER